MKATTFLSACSVVLALMIVAPVWAQDEEEELLTEAAQEVAPEAVPFVVRRVAVECNGDCCRVRLDEACAVAGSGFRAIAIDCQNVQEQGGVSCGAPPARCSVRTVSSADRVCNYCDDIGGWDANVYCAQ
jgi:hypothetical protein